MKAVRNIFLVLVALGFLVLTFFMFAPEPRTNAVKESYLRMIKDKGQGCLNYYRDTFLDPESLRLIRLGKLNGKEDTKDGDWIKVRAGNRGGGFGIVDRPCRDMGEDGGIDKSALNSIESLAILDAEILCLDAKKEHREHKQEGERHFDCSEEAARKQVLGD